MRENSAKNVLCLPVCLAKHQSAVVIQNWASCMDVRLMDVLDIHIRVHVLLSQFER